MLCAADPHRAAIKKQREEKVKAQADALVDAALASADVLARGINSSTCGYINARCDAIAARGITAQQAVDQVTATSYWRPATKSGKTKAWDRYRKVDLRNDLACGYLRRGHAVAPVHAGVP